MRFRLTTKPPLPSIKVWYAISHTPGLDISNLKAEILSRLPDLQNQGLSYDQIHLSIDDFELLDDSGLDVIRENDIVCISVIPDAQKVSRKRVLDSSSPVSRKRRKSLHPSTKQKKILSVPSSSGSQSSDTEDVSSSSSSSSSEVGSSSSEATSSSDSDSSDSESDSDSEVETQPSNIPLTNGALHSTQRSQQPQPVQENLVPPGMGKSVTHNRNARRRMKRFYDKQKAEAELLASKSISSDSPNAIPLGNVRMPTTVTQKAISSGTSMGGEHAPSPHPQTNGILSFVTVEAEQVSSTLRNKNKKKGFKRDMAGTAPQRIVFTTEDTPSIEPTSVTQETPTEKRIIPPTRLITPSEKQARGLLPSNMFVTSVEVEGNRWDRKKKKKQRDQYGSNGYGGGLEDDSYAAGGELNETALDYGEAEDTPSTNQNTSGLDWDLVESKWDILELIENIPLLSPGSFIGWKGLGISPSTCTPEMLVRVARVKEINLERSVVALAIMRRPGEDEIAFGGGGEPTEDGVGPEADAMEEVQEVTIEDARKDQWRLIQV